MKTTGFGVRGSVMASRHYKHIADLRLWTRAMAYLMEQGSLLLRANGSTLCDVLDRIAQDGY